jgi:regulator of RNase E activity RraA
MDLLDEFRGATSAIVSDALDKLGLRQQAQALDPAIRPLWDDAVVIGWARPVLVIADTSEPEHPYDGEMSALDSLEPGDVPLFAVEQGLRVASWGELFSCGAIGRGAQGAIVDGLVRDARQIRQLGFPTFARGCTPLDTYARAIVADHGCAAVVGGVYVTPGDLVVADIDGIVVVPRAAVRDAAEFVKSKRKLEEGARQDLLDGMRIRDVWAKYGVF